MIVDEMDLIGRFREVEALPAEIAGRAELVLRAAIALGDDDRIAETTLPVRNTRRRVEWPSFGRRRALSALAGVAVATALVVAATTILGGHRHAPTIGPTVSLPGAQTRTETVSYVVGRISTALEATAGGVWYNQARMYGAKGVLLGASESWIAPKVSAFRGENINAAGAPVSGMVINLAPPGRPAVYIDYEHHVWTAREQPPTGVALGFGGLPDTTIPPGSDAASAASAALRAAEASGELSLSGSGTYNGYRVIELQELTTPGRPDPLNGGSNTVWVDAGTYLPVREVITEPRDPQTGAETYDISFQWLPPTTSNLQLVTSAGAIPAGFSEVPPERYPGMLPNLGPPGH